MFASAVAIISGFAFSLNLRPLALLVHLGEALRVRSAWS